MTNENATIPDAFQEMFDTPVETFRGPLEEPPAEKVEEQPVEPVAEAPDEQSEEQEETASDEETGDADDGDESEEEERPKRRKRSVSMRIRKLASEREYWQQEARAAREELERLRNGAVSGLTAKEEKGSIANVEGPNPEKYRYGELDPQYISDLADYRAELKIAGFREEQEKARQADAEAREAARLHETATRITQAGTAKFSDFEEVVVEAARNGEYELTQEMFETLAETSAAAEILYYLASNPDEALSVSKMSPRQQALWFGRAEARFSAPPAPPARKATQAPPPPKTIAKGLSGKVGVPPDTDDLGAFEREFFSQK